MKRKGREGEVPFGKITGIVGDNRDTSGCPNVLFWRICSSSEKSGEGKGREEEEGRERKRESGYSYFKCAG